MKATNPKYKPAIAKLNKEARALHMKALRCYTNGFWIDGEAATKKALSMEVSAALLSQFKH
ncbi:MAG: hypothetical protein P4N60_11255 [Verrucomicrobiae bacterium]|nr:hypothetical protein [Verrucomicrobiae bacterium]